MKSNIHKIIFILGLTFIIIFPGQKVLANAPIISGNVLNELGQGIAGIFVEWSDNQPPTCDHGCSYHNIRYTQTDTWGNFKFCSYPSCGHCLAQRECLDGTMIDADLDGTPERRKVNIVGNGGCSGETHSDPVKKALCLPDPAPCCGYYSGFDCTNNSHKFSVVMPAGISGEFINSQSGNTDIKLDAVSNAGGEISIGTFRRVPAATNTPTPTPTPEIIANPANCNCDNMDLTGTPAPGQPLTFTSTAKVEDYPNNDGEVKDMIYTIERNDGKPNVQSDHISALGPTPVGNTYYYTTSWDYMVPTDGTPGTAVTYKVSCDISCDRRMAQNLQPDSRVMGLKSSRQSGKSSFFSAITGFFTKLLGLNPKTSSAGEVAGLSVPPPGTTTLKLGTFDPNATVEKYCRELIFTVNYP